MGRWLKQPRKVVSRFGAELADRPILVKLPNPLLSVGAVLPTGCP